MATAPHKLETYLNLLDRTLDLDHGRIEEAINGDYYIEFSVTTDTSFENRLERTILNTLNRAFDPNAYGIDTGPTNGENTSTYTVVWDKSNGDFDLISGGYDTYRNDLAGISDGDVPFARPGYATNMFLDDNAYRIAAPTAQVLGTSIPDWTARWWTWVLQAPAAGNPLFDSTGADADVDNIGPVFFLAGSVASDVERSFSVPAGRPVLIPVQNFVSVPFFNDPPGYALGQVEDWEESVSESSLSATIDGEPVKNIEKYLVRSNDFTPGPPVPGSLFDAGIPDGHPTDDPFFPSLSSGYWLMIEGLTPGPHTITVSGTTGGVATSLTDYILIA